MARLEPGSFPLLTSTIVKQLNARKILTVVDFIAETTENLMKITGLAYKVQKSYPFIKKKSK